MCSVDEGASASGPHQSKSTPPNRLCFESRIRQVNEQLNRTQNQLKNYWSKEERQKFAVELRDKLLHCKQLYVEGKRQNDALNHQLAELKERQKSKQSEVREMEMGPDLSIKDPVQAKAKLALVEERYRQHLFSTMREERQMVNEVDRLKRNVHRLGKYLPIVEQLNAVQAEITELRKKSRELRMRMRQHVDDIHATKQRIINELKQPFLRLRDISRDLKVEKRNLIEGYNDERSNYTQWLKGHVSEQVGLVDEIVVASTELKKPPRSTYPGTVPADPLQGDPLELFDTQKTACRRLIPYLERLVSSLPSFDTPLPPPLSSSTSQFTPPLSPNHNKEEDTESTDSAEDLPSSFQNIGLAKNAQQPQVPSQQCSSGKVASTCKGRSVEKRAAKKQAMVGDGGSRGVSRCRVGELSERSLQPLSHDIATIRMFQNLGLQVPKTRQDSQRALAEARRLLKFYEEQTELPPPGSSDEVLLADCLQSPIHSLFAPSESGTGYSAPGSQFTSPRSSSVCSLMNSSMEHKRELSADGPSGSLNSNSHSHSHSSSNQ